MSNGMKVYEIFYEVGKALLGNDSTAKAIRYVLLIGMAIYLLQRYGAYVEGKRRER